MAENKRTYRISMVKTGSGSLRCTVQLILPFPCSRDTYVRLVLLYRIQYVPGLAGSLLQPEGCLSNMISYLKVGPGENLGRYTVI